MTAQAKNRVLAALVLTALLVILSGCISNVSQDSSFTEVYIPSDNPVSAVVSNADSLDQKEFDCLRLNIYHEAGNQSRRGMEAVALVTVNRSRTKHFPDTICGVVHQAVVVDGEIQRYKCQFSWHCDGKDDKPRLTMQVKTKDGIKLVPNEQEVAAWNLAGEVARDAISGETEDFLGRATHYHATYVNPNWASARRMVRIAKVGTHVFYRDAWLKLKA